MANLEKISIASACPVAGHDVIFDTLSTMRSYLKMEVAFLSEFVGEKLVYRVVDAPGMEGRFQVGDARWLDQSYCHFIAQGKLPELIPDTSCDAIARTLSLTDDLPIGAIASVPVMRADGTVYGMFCCCSPHSNRSLNQRDLDMMRSFSGLAQSEIQRRLEREARKGALATVIQTIIQKQSFNIVFQPIIDLATGAMSGVEALCRFQAEPYRAPNLWFDDAISVGLGQPLEIAVMRKTLRAFDVLPDDMTLSLNATPRTVASGKLPALFAGLPTERIVLEVTEHMEVDDWSSLSRSLNEVRKLGVKIAIDDAGAGYSGLQQMVRLQPEIIKLDRSLVDRIDENPARRSLCAAMVHYAQETCATLVAEGIERPEEAEVLRALGVDRGQGFLLARPAALSDILAGSKPPIPLRASAASACGVAH